MIFDRYDIVEAHYALEVDYNRGGSFVGAIIKHA